ncbi:hypothetical protein ACFE04_013369 [Oxalis oulophora]
MEKLLQDIKTMRQSLFDEGLIGDHFERLEDLQDEKNPHLVQEILTLFFTDVQNSIAQMEQAMEEYRKNANKFWTALENIEGSTLCVGAKKLSYVVHLTRGHVEKEKIKDIEGVKKGLLKIKQELTVFQSKLNTYFQLLEQANSTQPGK